MTHARIRSALGAALLLALVPASAAEPVPRSQITPLWDVHQHSMSAAAKALIVPHPDLPPVEVPAPLARLLREREAVSGAPPVGAVFSDDAIILQHQEGRWWQGRERIDRFINHWPRQITLVPRHYALDGQAGYVAGGLQVEGSGKDDYTFLMGLRRDGDGPWQIASEMTREVPPPEYDRVIGGREIVDTLDDSGIRRAVVLSVAYWFASPMRDPPVADVEAKVRAENDFTIAEAARYPDRLVPFCSVNPLTAFAVSEIARCARIPAVKGIKLHFANARVDLDSPDDLRRLGQVFAAANAEGLALVVHLRTVGPYTGAQGQALLRDVLARAPDVTIQIAHLANDLDMADFLGAAIRRGDPRVRHVIFDTTGMVPTGRGAFTPPFAERAVATLRRIGLDRVYFGTDMAVGDNPPPRDHWHAFASLPLTDAELRDVADNVPPYAR